MKKEIRMKTWMGGALAALVLASGAGFAQEPPKEEPKKQEEGKKRGGPMALPTSAELKEACGLDEEQVKKVDEILASYKDKVAEAQKKIKGAEDKKAAVKEAGALRGEIAGKLVEVGKDDEQKKKLTEATAPPQRKKKE